MKICPACHTEKPLTDFHVRSKAKDGHQSRCKECAIRFRMAYYYLNHTVERVRLNQRQRELREENRHQLDAYLRIHPCVDCGETDIRVLEFDHVRGEKDRTISDLAHKVVWSSVLKEIEKCEVRCANDHRRRHNKNRFSTVT